MKRHPIKPPLGIVPKHLWIQKVYSKRLEDIREAIDRYSVVGRPVPKEWVSEHNLICIILQLDDSELI